jgi:uncharacterized membrane protein YeaQ/YmgE (transglycosylase-associated protein family)
MMVEGVIVWVLTGLVAGLLTTQFMPRGGYGITVDILLGVVGACLGGFAVNFSLPGQAGLPGTILAALVGAIVLTHLVRSLPWASPA